MGQREIVIDGNNFSDLEGFYQEMDRILTKDLQWSTGHNLNAFNDLLRGGFGVHEYYEPFKLIWINFAKSKNDLGREAAIEYYKIIIPQAHPTSQPSLRSSLQDLQVGKGESLSDIIVGIIKEHDHIDFEIKE